ncbi:MAG TPA: histidine triad nucleotide-binding protein [Actinomycetota bacterium]|nr:histidine triad nucleotide-binding protein [Actinomycetota bacterium]
MDDCLFCKIAAKDVGADIVHESESVVAFRDINPAAPAHVLVVPRRHVASAAELGAGDGDLLGEMFQVMAEVARAEGVDGGFRIVTNIGEAAGQSVHHLHFHVLGGRSLGWPPG